MTDKLSAIQQIKFFKCDVVKQVGPDRLRILTIWVSRSFWGLLQYRTERFCWLLFGPWYRFIRIPFIPLLNLIQAYSNIEIPYRADIKGGLQIFHPSMGIVVSQFARIGENVILYGGNVIGTRELHTGGAILIGNNCLLGANSVVLGPITIASGCRIGALACVIHDCLIEESSLVGVPARIKRKSYERIDEPIILNAECNI